MGEPFAGFIEGRIDGFGIGIEPVDPGEGLVHLGLKFQINLI